MTVVCTEGTLTVCSYIHDKKKKGRANFDSSLQHVCLTAGSLLMQVCCYKTFITHIEGLRTDGFVCDTDCKAPLRELCFFSSFSFLLN